MEVLSGRDCIATRVSPASIVSSNDRHEWLKEQTHLGEGFQTGTHATRSDELGHLHLFADEATVKVSTEHQDAVAQQVGDLCRWILKRCFATQIGLIVGLRELSQCGSQLSRTGWKHEREESSES